MVWISLADMAKPPGAAGRIAPPALKVQQCERIAF